MGSKIKVYKNGKLLKYFKDYTLRRSGLVNFKVRPRFNTKIRIESPKGFVIEETGFRYIKPSFCKSSRGLLFTSSYKIPFLTINSEKDFLKEFGRPNGN